MIFDKQQIAASISNFLEESGVRYEVHSFDSGCKMIDILLDDKFYCIQVEDCLIGISLVTEEIDLSTIPDQSFQKFDEFKHELNRILSITKTQN